MLTVLLLTGPSGCGKKRGDAKGSPTPVPTHPDNMEGGSGAGTTPTPTPTPVPGKEPQTDGKAKLVRVWYGTNREPVDRRDFNKGYSNERSVDGSAFHGTVVCRVPKSRPIGTLGSAWYKQLLKWEDDDITIRSIDRVNADTFYRSIRSQFANAPKDERCVLVYIHGYKNSFERAALRAAQLAVDLDVPGVTAFYSWPSKDTAGGYNADEATVEASEKHVREFLARMMDDTGAAKVHVIAHSMGNRVMARVVQKLLDKPDRKFGQIILAAPDVDAEAFHELAQAYPKLSDRTTLYVSKKDMALEASNWVHDFPRAGYMPPVTVVPNIDTVEVSSIDVSVLGHGYAAECETVLADIAHLLRVNAKPETRNRLLRAVNERGEAFWMMEGK